MNDRVTAYTGEFTIETASGGGFDLHRPTAAMVRHKDVAAGLGKACRFVGQCKPDIFYSVAEHSVLVSKLAPLALELERSDSWLEPITDMDQLRAQTAIAGLLHDAHEAYTGDMSTPMKAAMREFSDEAGCDSAYDAIASGVQAAILDYYGIGRVDARATQAVSKADRWAFVIEARRVMTSGGADYNIPQEVLAMGDLPGSVEWHGGLDPINAAALWIWEWSE